MRARQLPLLLATALVVLVPACGGQEPGRSVASLEEAGAGQDGALTDPARSEQEFREALERYQRCLAEHGVDGGSVGSSEGDGGPGRQEIPIDPGAAPPDQVSPEQRAQAQEQCRQFLPNGGVAPTPDAETLDKQREWVRCLREKGLEVKEAGPDNPGPMVGIPEGDEEARKKMEECDRQVFGSAPRPEPTR